MSYIIIKTDGTVLTTIPDGTLNTNSTPLSLPGRLYPGYGQVTDTNFVHLLENFANVDPPANAIQGQLWYNTTPAEEGLFLCPADGESNPSNWLKIITTTNGDVTFGNITANTIRANLVDTDYLTVRVQANIANANVTGLTELANLEAANITTGNITAGSNVDLGNLTGAWTVNGTATLNGASGTAMWVKGGNLLADGIKTDGWYYANGATVSFDGTYSNTNVAAYLDSVSLNATTLGGHFPSVSPGPDTIALRDGNGNVQANYFVGNGSALTGINTSIIFNGQSNVSIPNPSGDVTISAGGVSNVVTVNGSTLAVNGNVTAGNISATRLTGNLTTSSQPNITSVGTLTSLGVNGAITAVNITANTGVFTGNGSGLTNLPGTNVTGTVANATYAVSAGTAGTVTTNSQPNITSVGTLNYLIVSGNINSGNVIGSHFGNGTGLTNLAAANVVGKVANSAYADNANNAAFAGTVTNASQPNITTVGTLNSLSVTGNLAAGPITSSGNTDFSSGTQQVRNIVNQVTLSSQAIAGTVNIDLIGAPTTYYTATSAGNFTFNFRGNGSVTTNSYLPVGRAVTSTVMVTQLSSPNYLSAITIDGTPIVPKWLNGSVPTSGTPNSVNVYNFNIIKTASTPSYAVFASVESYADTPLLPTSATRTCIAVIDECSVDATIISNSWSAFRGTYPNRTFYLLQPGGPSSGPLKQPSSFTSDPKAFGPIAVNRDNGNPTEASDWYTICNLAALPNGSNFALWIDNSGSMTTATVQASVDLLNVKIAPRGLTYTLLTDGAENWIAPFNKVLN